MYEEVVIAVGKPDLHRSIKRTAFSISLALACEYQRHLEGQRTKAAEQSADVQLTQRL